MLNTDQVPYCVDCKQWRGFLHATLILITHAGRYGNKLEPTYPMSALRCKPHKKKKPSEDGRPRSCLDQKRPPKYLELMLSNMLRPTFVPNVVVLTWTRASAALDWYTLPLSIKTTRPDLSPPHPCTPTPHPTSNPTAQHGLIDFPVAHHVSHCETVYAPFQLHGWAPTTTMSVKQSILGKRVKKFAKKRFSDYDKTRNLCWITW